MNMPDLLMRFCACPAHDSVYLHAPWMWEGWVYYSDRRVVVRVPFNEAKHASVANLGRNPAAQVFAGRFDDGGPFVVLPKFNEPAICAACEGSREYDGDECFVCGGAGHDQEAVPMFDVPWSSYYLWLLSQLPQARIRDPEFNPKKPRPAEILFDGGQALLMPRRA